MINQQDRTDIVKEIKDWSKYVLEPRNPEFNDIPACPYARKAWKEKKVDIVFKEDKSYGLLSKTLENWDDSKDLVIIVDTAFIKREDRFHKYHDIINQRISENMYKDRDLWIMGFHPDDDEQELLDSEEFEPETDVEYALVFVQRLSKLEEAAEKLKSLGYYEKYFQKYDVEPMYKLRNKFYRRLQDGRC